MAIVGSVSVRVLPDTTNFVPSLEKFLRRVESRQRLSIPLDLDTGRLAEQLRTARARAQANPVNLKTDVDTTGASLSLRAFVARASLMSVQLGVGFDHRPLLAAGTALTRLSGAFAAVGANVLKFGALTAALGGLAQAALGAGAAVLNLSGALLLVPAMGAAAAVAIGTLVVGFQGFGDALKNISDPKKFAESLKNLAPAAQQTATAIRDLQKPFKALRLDVQGALFKDTGKTVADVAKLYLPVLHKGMVDVGTAMNSAAKNVAGFITNAQTVKDTGTLFANTSAGVTTLGRALRDVLFAFRDIGTVGSGFLPGLAQGAANAAAKFREFIGHARQTGQLKQWIQTGLDAFRQLGNIVKNVGSIILSVFRASGESGASFLSTIAGITKSVADFFKSAEGATALRQIFSGIGAALEGLSTLFVPLRQAFVTLAPAAASLGSSLGTAFTALGPAIVPVANALAAMAPMLGTIAATFANVLVSALQAVVPLFVAMAPVIQTIAVQLGGVLLQALTAIAPAMPAIVKGLAEVGTVIGNALGAAAPVISQVVGLLAKGLAQALAAVLPVLPPLVDAFVALLSSIAPVVPLIANLISAALPPFVQLMTQLLGVVGPMIPVLVQIATAALPPFLAAVSQLATALTPIIPLVGQIVATLLPPLLSLFTNLVTTLAPLVTAILGVAQQALPPLMAAFTAIIAAVQPLLPVLGQLVAALLPPLLNLILAVTPLLPPLAQLFSLVAQAVTPILGLVATLIGALLPPLISLFTAILTPIINIANAFLSKAVPAIQAVIRVVQDIISWFGGLIRGVVDAVGTVLDFFGKLGAKIVGALADAGSWLIETGANLINGLLKGLGNLAAKVGEFLLKLVKDAIGGILSFLGIGSPSRYMAKIGRWTVEGMTRGIGDGTPAAVKAAQSLADAVAISPEMTATVGAIGTAPSHVDTMRAAIAGLGIEVNAGQVTRWVDRQHLVDAGR